MVIRPVGVEAKLFHKLNKLNAVRKRLGPESDAEPRTGGSRVHPWVWWSCLPGRLVLQRSLVHQHRLRHRCARPSTSKTGCCRYVSLMSAFYRVASAGAPAG